MLMPSLLDQLQQHLHGWRDELPTAWCAKLGGVQPDYTAIPSDALLCSGERVVPVRRNGRGIFYALKGIDPADVAVVVIGNDPYPDPCRATGRSFEQGNLTEWDCDLMESGRVTPSLLSLACAAAALFPSVERLELDCGGLHDRRGKLQCALQRGRALLPPRSMFENLTGQGVLWLNRTPTISAFDSGRRRRGSTWKAIECRRELHRKLWCPVTRTIVSALLEETRSRPIVFALFGDKAKSLQSLVEDQRTRMRVSEENLHFVESGHPSVPRYFFHSGNPLKQINDKLIACGCDPIDWCGPTAGQTTANNTTSLSTNSQCTVGGAGMSVRTVDRRSAGASAHSIAIMDRTVGKYRTALRQLAKQ